MKKITNTVSDVKLMFKYVIENDKSLIILKILAILVNSLQLYIGTMYIKWILDYIINYDLPDFKNLILYILKIQIISICIYTISLLISKIIIPKREYKLKNVLQNVFISKSLMQDISIYENYSFYDNYTKCIRYADSKAIEIVNLVFSVFQQLLNLIIISSIIFMLDYYLFIIIGIMVIVSFIDQNISNKLSYKQYEAEQSIDRKSEYIKKISHHKDFVKEVRIFNLKDFLINKLNVNFKEKYAIYKDVNKKYWRFKYIIHIINSLILTPILIVYISINVIKGEISIGDFTVLFSACFSVSNYLSNIVNAIDKLNFESEYYISKLKKVLLCVGNIEISNNEKKELSKINKIEFRDVYFKYPEHEEIVLNNVCFIIEKNDSVALIGKNGSGKSTIIKLLLRLYDPLSGSIFINDVNIKDYDVKSLRNAFSVVMQDYKVYNLSIVDNICFDSNYDKEKLTDAIKFSGLQEKIDTLNNGVDSYIGREFDENGIDFSGGEMQKIAIARAFYKNNSCMILDEANSALDVYAEFKLNERILETSNNITIIISHRLATTTNVSKIIFIENGEIKEIGNHDELMNKKDYYYNMFIKQAEKYKINI